MTTDIRLIANGTTTYLINSTGSPVAGGAATAAATTPFALLREDWVMRGTQPLPIYQGGPPFRNGQTLAYQNYDTTQQQIGISVTGSSYDNAVSLLRALRRALSSAATIAPCILYYQPNGATSALYFNVLSASLQERPGPLNPSAGFSYIEADLTLTLAPFGGLLASGETLINAVSIKNTGTGTPDNVESLGTGAGDLIYEGQPLNLTLLTASGTTKMYLGSIDSRVYDASGAAALSSTNTTVGTDTLVSSPSVASALTNQRLKCRVMMRFSAMTSNARIKVKAGLNGKFFFGNEIDPDNNATIVDMGQIPLDTVRNLDTTATLGVWLNVRSSDGANATATLSYVETILYYDWCVITPASSITDVRLRGFTERSGAVCLPKDAPQFADWTGSTPLFVHPYAGTPPRYFSGASLYMAWLASTGAHGTTDSLTLTATHAPLYVAARGNG